MTYQFDPIAGLRHLNLSAAKQALAEDFLQYAHALVRARFDSVLALRQAEGKRATGDRVLTVLRAAVAAGSTTGWGEAIAPYDQMAEAFLTSLRHASVFDRLLSDGGMLRVPLQQKVSAVIGAFVGTSPGQAMVKPFTSGTFDAPSIAPQKSAALVVVTDEVAKLATPAATSLFNDLLSTAVAQATDSQFLASLFAAVTPTASSGSTTTAILTDLHVLLYQLNPAANSRVYFVCEPSTARAVVLARDSGGPAFPAARLDSQGEILPGVPMLVTDQLPDGVAMAIDAQGLCGDGGTIELDTARHASPQMSDVPDSPPSASTSVISLWQEGKLGLKAERAFGFSVVRTSAVAALSGVNYALGNSP